MTEHTPPITDPLRMEPQYMILGQAAGVAAAMAVESGLTVQEINPAALQQKLTRQGAILEYHPAPPRPSHPSFKQSIQN